MGKSYKRKICEVNKKHKKNKQKCINGYNNFMWVREDVLFFYWDQDFYSYNLEKIKWGVYD